MAAYMIDYGVYQAYAMTSARVEPLPPASPAPHPPVNLTIDVRGMGRYVGSVYSHVIGSIAMASCISKNATNYEEAMGSALPNNPAANGSTSRLGDYLSDEYDATLVSAGGCPDNKR